MFLIDGFDMPHRLDRNSNGGGLLLFVREDIPSNLEDIPSNLVEAEANPVEGFCVCFSVNVPNLNFWPSDFDKSQWLQKFY